MNKNNLNFDTKVDLFMYPYMFELEKQLLNHKKELKDITFHLDEANTDRELKEFIKTIIKMELNNLPNNDSIITLKNITNISDKVITIQYSNFSEIFIEEVFLPNQITDEIKEKINNNDSIYTNPDLCLKISNSKQSKYVSIELKSTKRNSIPGSSIQQINPKEWVIFIKHTSKTISITTGQYINSINSKLQFPDRSPRPQVAFNELKTWNRNNRKLQNKNLKYEIKPNEEKEKYSLINDWQSFLAERWLKVIKTKKTKRRIPWFNNNLRKFILKFIDFYDTLDNNKKKELKENIQNLIK